MEGTDNIDTMTRMSRLQPISSEIINILLSDGSSGNSTILRPSVVSLPVLSSAPRIHNWGKYSIISFQIVWYHRNVPEIFL